MRHQILYLDSSKSRPVLKALRKQGIVSHAGDINQALFLIAESDFEYYFVDADTAQAHAFLKHLKHDPQLAPPSATVLLSCNEEEDCAAWNVDTFITRNRVGEDIPYVFSHLRGTRRDPDNVLRIAPRDKKADGPSAIGDTDTGEVPPAREPDRQASPSVLGARHGYAVLALVLAACTLWMFIWGPLAAGKKGRRVQSEGKKVRAESSDAAGRSSFYTLSPSDYLASSSPAQLPQTQGASSQPTVVDSDGPPPEIAPASEGQATEQIAPAPPPANRPPSVSISGPSLVHVGQTVTFYANASDPDGGALSYSWGGSSRSTAFQNTGTFPISVTVTDSGGLSASGTFMVTVMQ